MNEKETEFTVSVEKRLYCTGSIKIMALSPTEAECKVQAKINKGEIQSTSVEWSDPDYEDLSFQTTGDVD